MGKYVYPAIFAPDAEGGYSVEFPNVEGCYSQGEDLADALDMAKDALELVLYEYEEEGREMPAGTPIKQVQADGDSFATLIEADTLAYRKMFNSKVVRKNVTIPGWLDDLARKQDVNISNVLKKALQQELHIAE